MFAAILLTAEHLSGSVNDHGTVVSIYILNPESPVVFDRSAGHLKGTVIDINSVHSLGGIMIAFYASPLHQHIAASADIQCSVCGVCQLAGTNRINNGQFPVYYENLPVSLSADGVPVQIENHIRTLRNRNFGQSRGNCNIITQRKIVNRLIGLVEIHDVLQLQIDRNFATKWKTAFAVADRCSRFGAHGAVCVHVVGCALDKAGAFLFRSRCRDCLQRHHCRCHAERKQDSENLFFHVLSSFGIAFGLYFITNNSSVSFSTSIWDCR